jgi:hypothetical protein
MPRTRGLILGVCLVACGDSGRETSLTVGTLPATDPGATDPTLSPTGPDTDTPTGTTITASGTTGTDPSTGEPSTGDPVCPADCADNGGVCLGGVCCEQAKACQDACCSADQVCSFGQCETPGAACLDAGECADGEYCEYSLGDPVLPGDPMCMGGVSLQEGKCLPEPPKCMEGEPPMEPLTCLPDCQYVPQASFSPVVKYHWMGHDIMMSPIVIQLDDDNCDGVVDERDIPEIVFTTFEGGQYNDQGTTRAISIVGGVVVDKWAANFPAEHINPGLEIAAGNIDGVPGNEVITCTATTRARALRADGTELWITANPVTCVRDGVPEVIVAGAILDGATGVVEVPLSGAGVEAYPSDLDVDGQLDIIHATGAFTAAGVVLAKTNMEGVFSAIADFDLDGKPEVAVIANGGPMYTHHLFLWRYNAAMPDGFELVRAPIDINGPLSPDLCPMGSAGNIAGGGAPTIADANGDGTPDVAVAGGVGYAVFDGKKLLDPNVAGPDTFLWIKQTQDCSSAATGSTVFDFDGDGSAEVLYSDEQQLRIYRGNDGTVLFNTCNTSGTLREFPVVADVDSDGHADIVAISNNYSSLNCDGVKTQGLRVFGDSQGLWVRTRRIWNQHPYHVSNVHEDGNIPVPEPANWTQPGLNNFRQNVQPEGQFSAPDLVVTLQLQCSPQDYGIIGRVRNIGAASVPAGVPVRFYENDPMMGGVLLGMGATTKVLYPAEAEDVILLLPNPPPGVVDGTSTVYVFVDDDMPMHPWHECRTDNNSATGKGKCEAPG